MEIAIPLYDRFTALDCIGPYDVLSRLPDTRVRFLGPAAGPVVADTGMVSIVAEAAWEDVPSPDVLVVPGGDGTQAALAEERLVSWIRDAHASSVWTTSVCTGSLLLGAAGVLDGLRATSHWLARPFLGAFGAIPVEERVVIEGKVVTAAGVSSGIDMGLVLAARIAGDETAQAIQLGIEYDPDPPFTTGSPATSPEPVIAAARAWLTGS